MSAATAIRRAGHGPRCKPECVRCANCSGSTLRPPKVVGVGYPGSLARDTAFPGASPGNEAQAASSL